MKDSCLIISQKYHMGHWSHIIAVYSLFNDLGYDSYLYVNPKFLLNTESKNFRTSNGFTFSDYQQYKVIVVLFPDVKNTLELLKFKFFGKAKLIYLWHEPIDSYLSFHIAGFTKHQLVRLFFVNQFNKLTAFISSVVLLPSCASYLIYKQYYKYVNYNFFLVPLLFDDEFKSSDLINSNKKYISYIGTIASDHAFNKFCNFINYAIKNHLFQDNIFLIATSNVLSPEVKNDLLTLREQVNLKIIDGNWLSNKEINHFFECSVVVWNAYDRSTQSGILPKAFMFGTPVLGNSLIPNEYIIQNHNGIYLNDNADVAEIAITVEKINDNIVNFSKNSRDTFLNKFYYKNYISELDRILNKE
jgi:glycosyltransferase involved in cell wall biosynthesis